MVFKYILSVAGDHFYPDKILDKIQGDFVMESFFKPTDRNWVSNFDQYGYGNISFWHPKKYSTEDWVAQYENDFIEFIARNHSFFVEHGATEFEIFMEIYFVDGGQCNLEVFDKKMLKKLADFGVSLPLSVYVLPPEEIQKWEAEIKKIWESR